MKYYRVIYAIEGSQDIHAETPEQAALDVTHWSDRRLHDNERTFIIKVEEVEK